MFKLLTLLFGRQIAEQVIWLLVQTFGGYAITKSFCSIFPLRKIITAPDFDAEIEKAKANYLANQPAMTNEVPGFKEWLEANK